MCRKTTRVLAYTQGLSQPDRLRAFPWIRHLRCLLDEFRHLFLEVWREVVALLGVQLVFVLLLLADFFHSLHESPSQVLLVPRVLLDVANPNPLGRVNGKNSSQQVLAFHREQVQVHPGEVPRLLFCQGRELLLEDVVHGGDAVGIVVRAIKGKGAEEHRKKQDSAGPHICPLRIVPLLRCPRGKHLGTHVARSSYCGEGVLLGTPLGESEIAHLNCGRRLVVEQGVVQLEVTMRKPILVAELHGRDELLEEVVGLRFRQEELPAAFPAPAPV
mmetsp:Transcript_3568/g.10065  ORF Transcript_3568/g.10065 Transcript_3568/m.10065 type:complete len:273 (-) Transcript_3568:13-831(-)